MRAGKAKVETINYERLFALKLRNQDLSCPTATLRQVQGDKQSL
jgi:hypothetical protein